MDISKYEMITKKPDQMTYNPIFYDNSIALSVT